MKKQILSVTLKYGLGLGLMIFIITRSWHQTDKDGNEVGIAALFEALLSGERSVHWPALALALVICGVGVLITFFRWFVLVRAQNLPFEPVDALRLGLFGFFVSTFLPGSVTGDIPKAYFLAREHTRRTVAVATVIVDRIIGLCALFWLVAFLGSAFWVTGVLGQLVQPGLGLEILQVIVAGSVALVVANVVFWLFLGLIGPDLGTRMAGRLASIPKMGHSLAELWRAALLYRTRGKSVLLAMALGLVAHNGFVLTFYLCSLTLYSASEIPSLGAHFLIVPVGMTIQAGFPTPGGLGGGEAAYSYLYAQVGSASGHGLIACLMQRVIYWVLAGLSYFAWARMKPQAKQAAVAEIKQAAATAEVAPGSGTP